MKHHFFYQTDIGRLCISAEDDCILQVSFSKRPFPESMEKETSIIAEARAQLEEYFQGKRRTFDLKLAPEGTPFQQKVWQALLTIPYGETRTYGQIAAQVGNPKASRAVGMANNRNPIGIIVPCHRVIGANGKLVGYAGGLDIKEKLLRLESGN